MGNMQCLPVYNKRGKQIQTDSFRITTAHKQSNLFDYKSNGTNLLLILLKPLRMLQLATYGILIII